MKKEIYLILDNIRSRENVGSIFRTADAAGVSKIYLCGITPVPESESIEKNKGDNGNKYDNNKLCLYHDRDINIKLEFGGCSGKISKTALGAEKWVPWGYHPQTWRLLRKLKMNPPAGGEKIKIIGLEQSKKAENIFSLKPSKLKANKLALIVGNEVRGISPKILKYCDKIVHIPMHGRKESLNVSVSVGIALYQLTAHYTS